MISWTRLLTGETQDNDNLRYSNHLNCIPRIVVWNTTRNCNLSCRHCYFGAMNTTGSNQLSTEEAKAFIKDLAKIGVPALLFSGGEPLLRKDIFELAKLTKDIRIRSVLSTNGTLITSGMARKVKQAGFFYVGISLDGKEETNDRFRQNKGAFQRTLAGLRNCQDAGLKVGLRFTLTKYNFPDLPYIFELVERESIARFCLYHLVYSGRGVNLSNQDLTHRERREVLEFIWEKTFYFYQKGLKIEILTVDNHADGAWIYLKLKKYNPIQAQEALELLRAQGGNSSGIKIGAVDDCGRVYADQFLQSHPLGNIRDKRFSDIWSDSRNPFLFKLRNRHLFLKGRCRRCNFLLICNGNLRARAQAAFGDVWMDDPVCYLKDKEIYEDGKICS